MGPYTSYTERCERKCCNVSTILRRVYIVITIHKSQGMTIDPNKIFEHAVAHFPSDIMKKTTCIELVPFSVGMNLLLFR